MEYMRLGELLIAAGAITQEQLERGMELQKKSRERLGTALIKNGIITEAQLIEALQMQLGIEFIDLTKVTIPTDMAQALPRNLAKQHNVVPVRMEKDTLYLAMSDPLNFYATGEIKKVVRKRIVPMVATASGVEHAIQVLYSNEGAAKAIEDMKREAAINGDETSAQNAAFATTRVDDVGASNAPTIRLVNSMMERSVTERASDIHMEPREDHMRVRMRIDGVMRSILTIPQAVQSSVISRIKVMANLDIAERRVPLDGRFNIQIKDKSIDVRVSTLPTVYGEKVVMRLLDKSGGRVTKDAVGLTGADLEKYDEMLSLRSGVLLLVGPTGSGKTTTMYAMINQLNTDEVNLVTLEDPVEYNVDGVNQVQINEKTGMTFAGGLRSILRQDPDIIAVGEIRDGETAGIAMRAAITGHIVLSTIHTNDAVGTIDRLRDIGVEPYVIASALRGVISQRLVRRICPHCRESYEPTDMELRQLGLEPEERFPFYRGVGCQQCYNTGYLGRAAVFEMLTIDDEISALIYEQAGRKEIDEVLKRPEKGFVSMRQNALRLMREGVTTGEEVLRVISKNN